MVVITGDPEAGLTANRTLQKPFTPDDLLGALAPFLPELAAVPVEPLPNKLIRT